MVTAAHRLTDSRERQAQFVAEPPRDLNASRHRVFSEEPVAAHHVGRVNLSAPAHGADDGVGGIASYDVRFHVR